MILVILRENEKAHQSNQPQQTQINTYGGNIGTSKYNPVTARNHLATYIVQAEQSFSMANGPVLE